MFNSAVHTMASDLKMILDNVAAEDYEHEKLDIATNLPLFQSLLVKISKAKRWDLALWVEGSKVTAAETYETALNLLEHGHLVTGQMKYTEHNAYREYQLTEKGADLVKKLLRG
jgi:hypothetical protein